jgi:hypothetical protein
MPLQFYAFRQFVSQAKGLLSAALEGLTIFSKAFFYQESSKSSTMTVIKSINQKS